MGSSGVAGGGVSGPSTAAVLAYLGMSADVVDTCPRWACPNATSTFTDGTLYLTYFTPIASVTVDAISYQGANPSSGLTLCKFGLYTAAANGDVTLVARTASDTTTFSIANTLETKSFATTGGFPATYDLVAGTLYAVGLLQVGATPGGAMVQGPRIPAVSVAAPYIGAIKASQTDIAGDVTSVSAPAANLSIPWARLS